MPKDPSPSKRCGCVIIREKRILQHSFKPRNIAGKALVLNQMNNLFCTGRAALTPGTQRGTEEVAEQAGAAQCPMNLAGHYPQGPKWITEENQQCCLYR